MSFLLPQPSSTEFTIYARENCGYCVKAKELLKDTSPVIVQCDEYLKQDRANFLSSMDALTQREYRTFPMIFHLGKFVGGYTDAVTYLEQLKVFNNDDF